MTWFRIDPVAKAIIKSLEVHPERWRTDDFYLLFGEGELHEAPVKLFVSSTVKEVYVENPSITLDRRSRRALYIARQGWHATCGKSSEQSNREALLAALKECEGECL